MSEQRVYVPIVPGAVAAIRAGADAAPAAGLGYAVTSRLRRELGLAPGTVLGGEELELAEFEAFAQAVRAALPSPGQSPGRTPGRIVVVAADLSADAVVERADLPASAAVELPAGVRAAAVVCAHVGDPADPAANSENAESDPMSMSWYDVGEFDELADLLARD